MFIVSRSVRRWLSLHLPAGLIHHPAEAFLAGLCIVSSVGALAAGGRASETVHAAVPLPVYVLWHVMLLVGAFALLVGLFSMKHTKIGYDITRPAAYRLGLRLMMLSALIYAAVLVFFAGPEGYLAGGITAAYGLMLGFRLLAIGGDS